MYGPDKDTLFPLAHHKKLCFLKNLINHPSIEVGDFTYYDDLLDVQNFIRNVKYHFEFTGDKLKIGKFCMIASGASFIMNGSNHLTDAISSYPFAIFGNGWEDAMENKEYPYKGDTVIGNDVWLGHNATITAGINIGDGAIIATNATVVKDVEPYSIVGGNPAQLIRYRFPKDKINELLKLRWWDWDISKITHNLNFLTSNDLSKISSLSE